MRRDCVRVATSRLARQLPAPAIRDEPMPPQHEHLGTVLSRLTKRTTRPAVNGNESPSGTAAKYRSHRVDSRWRPGGAGAAEGAGLVPGQRAGPGAEADPVALGTELCWPGPQRTRPAQNGQRLAATVPRRGRRRRAARFRPTTWSRTGRRRPVGSTRRRRGLPRCRPRGPSGPRTPRGSSRRRL